MRKLFALTFFISFSSVIPLFAQDDDFTKDIRKLLEVTGAEQQMIQSLNIMTDSFKRNLSDVPPEFWDQFVIEAKKDMNSLLNDMAELYKKHYNENEVKALIKFYSSDLGKKILAKTPIIQQEAFRMGEEWGRGLARKVQEASKDY